MSVDALLARAKEINTWLDMSIHGLPCRTTDRLLFAGALFDLVHEHAKAVRLLIDQPHDQRLVGVAFALVRTIFETFMRGLWLRHCATDDEIEKFQRDRLDKNLTEIVAAVEATEGYNLGVLARVKREYWSGMCSYAHSGFLQAVRRITSEHIAPSYSDDEIEEVIRFVTSFALLAGHEVFSIADRGDLRGQVIQRLNGLNPSAA